MPITFLVVVVLRDAKQRNIGVAGVGNIADPCGYRPQITASVPPLNMSTVWRAAPPYMFKTSLITVAHTGGQLDSVLMQPTPQLSVKTWGGGVGGRGGEGGGDWQLGQRGGGSQRGGGGCARPTTTTCIPQGGVCVWGHGVIEVCRR